MTGLTGRIKMPKMATGANAVFVEELADVGDGAGTDGSVMFAKADGKKYQITCDGPCGCREVYSFATNSASCSCDDCVMSVEEVSSN